MPKDIIPILLTGGMANAISPLRLFLRNKGELANLVNADLSTFGEIGLLRPKATINGTTENAIHSIIVANDVICIGVDEYFKYWNEPSFTTLLSSLASEDPLSIAHAGKWLFLANGTEKKSVCLNNGVNTGCDWGVARPTTAPTVADGGAGGDLDYVYLCYYRYLITLPDGTEIRTALSPSASVDLTATDRKLDWSNITYPSFEGATSIQAELFRTVIGWDATYLVTTLDSGTTSLTGENESDATIQANVAFDETGYYPPPDNPDLAFYHPGADRVFCTVGNTIYWSEAGLYHIFKWSASAGEYSNINDVYLSGENVTALQLWDEQLYIGSKKGWRRLRGNNPSDGWAWEDVTAEAGPISDKTVAKTSVGLVYPDVKGRMWAFAGFTTSRIIEGYNFAVDPDTLSHATWDGRFYRLYHSDTDHPELIIDFFLGTPKVVKSTRDANCSFYDKPNIKVYVGTSDGYIEEQSDTDASATLTILTPEIPVESLNILGDMATLVMRVNSQGANINIIPIHDGVRLASLTSISTSSYQFVRIPLKMTMEYTLQFEITITSNKDIKIGDPLILTKSD